MSDRKADTFRQQISSWSHLAQLVEHFSFYNGHDWLFRGVRDAEKHTLVPRIGRKETRRTKEVPGTKQRVRIPYRLEDERAVLVMLRQQARPYLSSVPQSDLEWLAIAQHFGLPTRLLDWTDMLLAAAWFAVEDGGGDKINSALWVTRGVPSVNDNSPDPLEIEEARVYRPPHIDARIAAQGSVLMICPRPTEEVSLTSCNKIVIVHSAQFEIKKRLSACGINRRSLFPDLSGLTQHLTWMYKNDWLAGYRSEPCSSEMDTEDDASD